MTTLFINDIYIKDYLKLYQLFKINNLKLNDVKLSKMIEN